MGLAQYGGAQYSGTQSGGTNIPDLETEILLINENITRTQTKDSTMKFFKVDDEKPEFSDTLEKADGTAIDLSSADKVEIRYEDPSGNVTTDTTTIVNQSGGGVDYQFPMNEIDEKGLWVYEYLVTYSDGTEVTVPNGDNYNEIQVGERL